MPPPLSDSSSSHSYRTRATNSDASYSAASDASYSPSSTCSSDDGRLPIPEVTRRLVEAEASALIRDTMDWDALSGAMEEDGRKWSDVGEGRRRAVPPRREEGREGGVTDWKFPPLWYCIIMVGVLLALLLPALFSTRSNEASSISSEGEGEGEGEGEILKKWRAAGMVRPSDLVAIQNIGSALGRDWMDWITMLPLGCETWTRLREGKAHAPLHKIQSALRGLPHREAIRNAVQVEVREAVWTRGAWLKSAVDNTARGNVLGNVIPYRTLRIWGIYDHHLSTLTRTTLLGQYLQWWAEQELHVWDVYNTLLTDLHLAASTRMVEVNRKVFHLVKESVESHFDYPESTRGPFAWVEEEATIARAREEYGILTFLAMFSHALRQAIPVRQHTLRQLHSNITHAIQISSECARNKTCSIDLRIAEMYENFIQWSPSVDRLSNERRLEPRIVSHSALRWVVAHSHSPHSPFDPKKTPPEYITSFNYEPCIPFELRGSNRSSSNPCDLSPALCSSSPTILFYHLSYTSWLHPYLGPASWHWGGATELRRIAGEYNKHIEYWLLHLGLRCYDPEIEERRFDMYGRPDGKNLRLDRGQVVGIGLRRAREEYEN